MYCVYLLQSIKYKSKRYVGVSANLKQRLKDHNLGKSIHTSKFCPWKLVSAVYFNDKNKAYSFEDYLKSGSGSAFANKHLW
ncbi:MAG: GIY-YIG nuclease family protein [Chlamydiota bacterium]|nr:GIY-YIG nuclease family protein [Chlamydiota bacterium]